MKDETITFQVDEKDSYLTMKLEDFIKLNSPIQLEFTQ